MLKLEKEDSLQICFSFELNPFQWMLIPFFTSGKMTVFSVTWLFLTIDLHFFKNIEWKDLIDNAENSDMNLTE